jgi:hypothetical protein
MFVFENPSSYILRIYKNKAKWLTSSESKKGFGYKVLLKAKTRRRLIKFYLVGLLSYLCDI